MVVQLLLNAVSFFSGVINQNLAFLLHPVSELLSIVSDLIADLISLEAFDIAWGWLHWAIPSDVWLALGFIITIEVGMFAMSFVFGCIRFIKVYVPIA